jgi:hypothetical protein
MVETKITARSRDFVEEINNLSGSLRQRANALGAQSLLHLAAILDDRHLLQVGAEGAVGFPHGEGDVVTEDSCFTTVSAFSHSLTSFLTDDSGLFWQAAYFTTIRILVQYEC